MTTVVQAAHARLTSKGSFYERNGGSFKGKPHMTLEEEIEYVRTEFMNPKSNLWDETDGRVFLTDIGIVAPTEGWTKREDAAARSLSSRT